MSKKNKIVLFCAIAILFIITRINVFFVSHRNNDEIIYLILANKIETYGFNIFPHNYNLYNIGIEKYEKYFSLKKTDIPDEQFLNILVDRTLGC